MSNPDIYAHHFIFDAGLTGLSIAQLVYPTVNLLLDICLFCSEYLLPYYIELETKIADVIPNLQKIQEQN